MNSFDADLCDVIVLSKDAYPLIYSTALNGMYHGNPYFQKINRSIFMKNYHLAVEQILSAAHTKVEAVVLKEDHDVILGYCISVSTGTITAVHWVYVKPKFRNKGICNMLLPKNLNYYTHYSVAGEAIAKKKSIMLNPFII